MMQTKCGGPLTIDMITIGPLFMGPLTWLLLGLYWAFYITNKSPFQTLSEISMWVLPNFCIPKGASVFYPVQTYDFQEDLPRIVASVLLGLSLFTLSTYDFQEDLPCQGLRPPCSIHGSQTFVQWNHSRQVLIQFVFQVNQIVWFMFLQGYDPVNIKLLQWPPNQQHFYCHCMWTMSKVETLQILM